MPNGVIENFHRVVAFRPTGWVGNKPTRSEKNYTVTLRPPTKKMPAESPEGRAVLLKQAHAASTPGKQAKGIRPRKAKMVDVPCGPSRKHTLSVSIHGVPYSEHSTYPELEQFVRTLSECGLRDIIPTVSVASARDMVKKAWGHLLNKDPNQVAADATALGAVVQGSSAAAVASNGAPAASFTPAAQ